MSLPSSSTDAEATHSSASSSSQEEAAEDVAALEEWSQFSTGHHQHVTQVRRVPSLDADWWVKEVKAAKENKDCGVPRGEL
jgi:hypothetical protein